MPEVGKAKNHCISATRFSRNQEMAAHRNSRMEGSGAWTEEDEGEAVWEAAAPSSPPLQHWAAPSPTRSSPKVSSLERGILRVSGQTEVTGTGEGVSCRREKSGFAVCWKLRPPGSPSPPAPRTTQLDLYLQAGDLRRLLQGIWDPTRKDLKPFTHTHTYTHTHTHTHNSKQPRNRQYVCVSREDYY